MFRNGCLQNIQIQRVYPDRIMELFRGGIRHFGVWHEDPPSRVLFIVSEGPNLPLHCSPPVVYFLH